MVEVAFLEMLRDRYLEALFAVPPDVVVFLVEPEFIKHLLKLCLVGAIPDVKDLLVDGVSYIKFFFNYAHPPSLLSLVIISHRLGPWYLCWFLLKNLILAAFTVRPK